MIRSLLAGAVVSALLAVSTVVGSPAVADPGGAGCTLSGAADFTPNGPGLQAAFGYSLTGTLTNCQSVLCPAPCGLWKVDSCTTERNW